MPESHHILASAHALTTFDSHLQALRAITLMPNRPQGMQLLIEQSTRAAEVWGANWAALRGHLRWRYDEAVADARVYLRVHIEEYTVWETELNQYLDQPE